MTDRDIVGLPAQFPPVLVLCMTPAAVPWSSKSEVDLHDKRHGQTHNIAVIMSQITELAILASKWLAPSTIHIMYAVENNVVHTALNTKSINL